MSFASRGVPVTVAVDTDYPFRETLAITVRPERSAAFPLVLRVPAWAEGATVRVGGRRGAADAGGLASPGRARVERRDDARRALPDASRSSACATTRRSRSSAGRSSTRSGSTRSGRASTRTSRTASCRTGISRCGRSRPGTTGSCSTRSVPRSRWSSRSGRSARSRSRLRVRAWSRGRRGRRIAAWKLAHGWAGEVSRADPAWAHQHKADSLGPVEEVTPRAVWLHQHPDHRVPAPRSRTEGA